MHSEDILIYIFIYNTDVFVRADSHITKLGVGKTGLATLARVHKSCECSHNGLCIVLTLRLSVSGAHALNHLSH